MCCVCVDKRFVSMARYTVKGFHAIGPMRIKVLFFGMLKDVVGRDQDELDVPEGTLVADLLAQYEVRFPDLRKSLPSLALAVNQQYAARDSRLKAGDEIALLPPVSGGAPLA